MRADDEFVRGVADALAAADRHDGIASMSDVSVAARLATGRYETSTAAVTVATVAMLGEPANCGLVDDPINAANGNFVHRDVDLVFLREALHLRARTDDLSATLHPTDAEIPHRWLFLPICSDADLDDIQGLVRFGYRGYPYAAYALIRFGADHAANRRWVRTLVASGPIDTAVKSRRPAEGVGLNLAFTRLGLEALELDRDAIATFSQPFREGMADPFRRRILGDARDEADGPATWEWGDVLPGGQVDALLLVFAALADPRSGSRRAFWFLIGQAGMFAAVGTPSRTNEIQ